MKYLTLMIVPYPGADVRNYRIQHRTLKIIAVIGVVLFIASVGALIYLRPVFNRAKEYARELELDGWQCDPPIMPPNEF